MKKIETSYAKDLENKKRTVTSEIADLVGAISLRYKESFNTWHWVVRRAVKIIGVAGVYRLFKDSPEPQFLMKKLTQIHKDSKLHKSDT